jgi:hypothetical protein
MGPKKKAGTYFILIKILEHKMMLKKLSSYKTKLRLFNYKSYGNNNEQIDQKHKKS